MITLGAHLNETKIITIATEMIIKPLQTFPIAAETIRTTEHYNTTN
jgi:hypothetical protein